MGKKKIAIVKIENKQSRMVTFSRRRNGLFKKAKDFSNLSGSSVAILVISPAGGRYTYASPSFNSVVDQFLCETIDGPSTVTAGSSSFDYVDDQFLPTTNAGSTSIDSMLDQFLSTTDGPSTVAAGSSSFDYVGDQFLPTTNAGSTSIDSMLDQFLSTTDGPSTVAAGSSSFDYVEDQFLPTTNAGSTFIDSMVDQFLSTTAASPSCDSMIDQFLSTAAGSPSVDSMADLATVDSSTATAGSFTTNCRSFRDTLKALSDINIEACNDLEELMALKSNLEQVIRERTRLI